MKTYEADIQAVFGDGSYLSHRFQVRASSFPVALRRAVWEAGRTFKDRRGAVYSVRVCEEATQDRQPA